MRRRRPNPAGKPPRSSPAPGGRAGRSRPGAVRDWRPSGAERAFSWFPGHMLKAQQRLGEELKQVDLIVELRDARLPLRSANPELARIAGAKRRLVALNKASLADPKTSAAWLRFFAAEGMPHLLVDADSQLGLAALAEHIALWTRPTLDKLRARGIHPSPPRVAIVGLPNVGKSTLINRLAKRARAKTAPTPGVTRHLAWIDVQGKFSLLDSPGIMLPRIASEADALALTWIGAIPVAVLGANRVAMALLEHMLRRGVNVPDHAWWPSDWRARGAEPSLEYVGRHRGFLAGGGKVDPAKTGQFVLDQYREGNLGRVTFDIPPAAGANRP